MDGFVTTPEFEVWWADHKIECTVPAMELAFKEIAWKGWSAGQEELNAEITKIMRKLNGWKD